jgi:hypothetical protein
MHTETSISEKGVQRIFEGELLEVRTRGGTLHHLRGVGYHLEDEAVMSARGHVINELSRTTPDSRGVYRAEVIIEGKQKRGGGGQGQAFFPYNWRRSQVLEAIAEAHANRQPHNVGEQGRFFKGRTARGMQIVMELDEAGRVVNAFPLRAKVNPRREALYKIDRGLQRKGKYVCGKCHSLKYLCCPFGHGDPKRRGIIARLKKLAQCLRSKLR